MFIISIFHLSVYLWHIARIHYTLPPASSLKMEKLELTGHFKTNIIYLTFGEGISYAAQLYSEFQRDTEQTIRS